MLKNFGLKKIVMSFALLAAAACANPPVAEQATTLAAARAALAAGLALIKPRGAASAAISALFVAYPAPR